VRSSFGLALVSLALAGVVDCQRGKGDVPCAVDDDCGPDETCIDEVCGEATVCSLDDPCSKGFACVAAEVDGRCLFVQGGRRLTDDCTSDVECDSGACTGTVCVNGCTLDDACADGLRCVLDGPRRVCVSPLADGVDGAACTDPRDCLSGTCVRPPTPDDSGTPVCAPACDAAHACAAVGDLCLPLKEGARACLAALDDGAPCLGGGDVCAGGRCIVDRDGSAICASPCVDEACADGFVCVDDADGGRICMPQRNEFADGEACVDERDCVSQICGRYAANGFAASLCASPCPPGGCGADRVCWEGDDVDLCGPIPP
jgi:hypothetical protein